MTIRTYAYAFFNHVVVVGLEFIFKLDFFGVVLGSHLVGPFSIQRW